MNYPKVLFCFFIVSFFIIGQKEVLLQEKDKDAFKVQTEQFADLAILRYRIPGF